MGRDTVSEELGQGGMNQPDGEKVQLTTGGYPKCSVKSSVSKLAGCDILSSSGAFVYLQKLENASSRESPIGDFSRVEGGFSMPEAQGVDD